MLLNDFSLQFQEKGGYSFEQNLVNISDERKCIRVKDLLGQEGQKIFDTLDSAEGEDTNDFDLVWTKQGGAANLECNEIDSSKKFKREGI